MTDREIVRNLINNDEETINEFFFVRCRKALTYIGRYYFHDSRMPEELIGEFYEFLSSDDWHKLRIFKFSCSLNSYITIIASRYFQHKRDHEMISIEDNGEVRRKGIVPGFTGFFMNDLNRAIDMMCPLDKFLLKRILVEGNKPGDIIPEAKEFMKCESNASTSAPDDKKFAAYVYTRYNRARKSLMKQMVGMGYSI